MLKSLYGSFIDLIFPPKCTICRQKLTTFSPTEILCPQCTKHIPSNKPPFCLKCSRHLPLSYHYSQCRDCLTHPIYFDFAWSALIYEEPFKKLFHDFKFNQKTLLRHFFGRVMTDFIKTHHLDVRQFNMIIPIPLSKTRLRERGYNQSSCLAEALAEYYNINLNINILIRYKHTKPQSSLERKERWTNIHGAFKIKHPWLIDNKNILLVDDLLTTGATLSEAAYTLKKSGAKTVAAYTLAVTY